MCDLLGERIRISQILNEAACGFGVGHSFEQMTERCLAALEAHYDGVCVEECLRRKAEEFAALWLAAGPARGRASDGGARHV